MPFPCPTPNWVRPFLHLCQYCLHQPGLRRKSFTSPATQEPVAGDVVDGSNPGMTFCMQSMCALRPFWSCAEHSRRLWSQGSSIALLVLSWVTLKSSLKAKDCLHLMWLLCHVYVRALEVNDALDNDTLFKSWQTKAQGTRGHFAKHNWIRKMLFCCQKMNVSIFIFLTGFRAFLLLPQDEN